MNSSQFFGNSPFDTAKKCFAENNILFGGSERPANQRDTEKFNLYNGLANLAIGLERLQSDIDEIKAALQQLQKQR